LAIMWHLNQVKHLSINIFKKCKG